MRTYNNLYAKSLAHLKLLHDRKEFTEQAEAEFEKTLRRTNRLRKKVLAEEEIFFLTPRGLVAIRKANSWTG